MKEKMIEHLRSSRFYLSMILGGFISGLLASAIFRNSGSLLGMFLVMAFGAIISTLLSKPGHWLVGGITGAVTGAIGAGFTCLFATIPAGTIVALFAGAIAVGFVAGFIVNFCQTSHTIRNVFHSPRFVIGFTIITIIILVAVFYPMIDTRDPLYIYGDGFLRPGTYFSIYDANIAAFNTTTVHRITDDTAEQTRIEGFLPASQLQVIVEYLARKSAWENDYVVLADTMTNDAGNVVEADVQLVIERRIARLQREIEGLNATIAENRERMAGLPERARANIQKAVDSLLTQVEAKEHMIEELRANLSAGRVITNAEAVLMWTTETGLSADNEYRDQLLEMWATNYDAVIAADSKEALALLGIISSGEDFNNGLDFITNENGLAILAATANDYYRIGRALTIDPKGAMTYTQTSSKSGSEPLTQPILQTDYTTVGEVANHITFPLGTDNFGRDMLLRLVAATGKSLLIGLLAGSIATLIGILVGLLAGYVGGWLDDILTFIMNLFTVIPGFVLIIIIYNAVDKDARGIIMCGMIIGFTSWVWTARSVRSQVISLRNRDHVNLSKLSGHSLFRIILTDILPYIASYVVMAFILQVSSGILAEAQLSILGLGPEESKDGATLGLLMNWAKLFGAYTSSNAWWAYFPVIGTIALISFSLNLMNTGLDQVFNPTLRD